jgi:hypothetical protein
LGKKGALTGGTGGQRQRGKGCGSGLPNRRTGLAQEEEGEEGARGPARRERQQADWPAWAGRREGEVKEVFFF